MTPQTPQQPTATTATAPVTAAQIEQSNFAALDSVIGETEKQQRDRLIVTRCEFDMHQRYARAFAKSGCFADIKGSNEEQAIAQAMVKIELGKSMGFSPSESMSGIDLIKGRPAIGANLRAARMKRAGYDWPGMVLNDKGCFIPLRFRGAQMERQASNPDGTPKFLPDGVPVMEPVVVEFTEKDAARAGLLQKEGTNYKPYPRNMYFARAVTNAQRWYAPEVLGMVSIPTSEEVWEYSDAGETRTVAMPQARSVATNGLAETGV